MTQRLPGLVLLLVAAVAHAQQEVVLPSLDGTQLKATWLAPKVAATSKTGDMATDATPPARLPVVVALHGCGGLYARTGARKGQLNARHQAMGEMLQGMGYHVVLPDSLSARGEDSLCAQPIGTRKITQTQRRADAFGALEWVRAQPWADPLRVAVIGWSHGGSAVLAVTEAANRNAASVEPFKAAIAFYPGCSDSLDKKYQPNTSLTLFLGADDDWTPPGPCLSMAEQIKAQPRAQGAPTSSPVELHVYPGAVHDFDTPLPGVRERKEIPSRLHPGKGVMAGQNAAAREASYKRVREVLQEAFK
jgi:dienelactone hydrolase